ncbi:Uncharacterized protein TCAP_06814 [Tolypocladium capitatum]|uniref:HNH nuclease domain-containing protein n=1 Tax=Tolypocladium capitatum TaxID=45235 RepID=A0A2K3Q6X4_9HYPO|nr:Uncharacterized protein TCAP_06814 [Tolypocladium capitatum]
MSSAAVAPYMRAHGWNIHFLAGPYQDRFAGLFHPPDSNTLSYRDIINEFRLCFQIAQNIGPSDDEPSDPWSDIAFWHAGFVNVNLLPPRTDAFTPTPTLICGQYLDQPVSAPPSEPSADLARPSISRFHIVRHMDCDIALTEPLAAHLRAGCAEHIPFPSLRRDDRYLPPNKGSKDPGFTRLPCRKTTRLTRSSQSPPKRSASSSIRSNPQDAGSDEVESLVAPPMMDIPIEIARQTKTAFRSSCLTASVMCAVTGKGRSWCINPPFGPALQACHIVPQQHYHVYPVPTFTSASRYSATRLREAWERTWSPRNGILLLSHLHELFDARLFSIHPETLRIRVFVPYDVISDYHGSIAELPTIVDLRALRHHYEMTCIENMAAEMSLAGQYIDSEQGTTPADLGTISLFDSGSNIPIMSPMNARGHADNSRPSQGPPGDPSKRTRRAQEDSASLDQLAHDATPSSTDGPSAISLPWRGSSEDVKHTLEEVDDSFLKKRQRIVSGKETIWVNNEDCQTMDKYYHPGWEGCITPWNHRFFLADVNYKLGNFRQ